MIRVLYLSYKEKILPPLIIDYAKFVLKLVPSENRYIVRCRLSLPTTYTKALRETTVLKYTNSIEPYTYDKSA